MQLREEKVNPMTLKRRNRKKSPVFITRKLVELLMKNLKKNGKTEATLTLKNIRDFGGITAVLTIRLPNYE